MPPKGYRLTGPERGWSQDQLIYMRWTCWPISEKDPNYIGKEQIANLLGVDSDTLRNWERSPGWDDAVQAMAQQVMLELDPLFYRNIAENMLSHKPSDKILQTYYRYIRPAIERNRPLWEKLIQAKTEMAESAEDRRIELTKEIMDLPTEQRDVILAYWRRLIAEPEAGAAQVLPPAKHADFKRQPGNRNTQEQAQRVRATTYKRKAAPLTFLPIAKNPQIDEQDSE